MPFPMSSHLLRNITARKASTFRVLLFSIISLLTSMIVSIYNEENQTEWMI